MPNVTVEIRGFDLPGSSCDPAPGERFENIHVGLARRSETVELVPGDAPTARWTFEIEVHPEDAGTFDFRGPFVLGRKGERHLGLRWGTVDRDEFSLFRAAKFRLFELEPALVREAIDTGRLVAEVDLTDEEGNPRCATVRPPHVTWSAGS
jgi:uncharacterized protein DUF5990